MSTGSLNRFAGSDPLMIRTIVRPPEDFAGVLQYGLRLLVQPVPPPIKGARRSLSGSAGIIDQNPPASS
jgi:hypothetical protein